jgi:hypothetical protein
MQLSAAEMFFFVPIPTRAKNAWSSSTCLLYDADLAGLVPATDVLAVNVSWLKYIYH